MDPHYRRVDFLFRLSFAAADNVFTQAFSKGVGFYLKSLAESNT